jgi:hypothetical protein
VIIAVVARYRVPAIYFVRSFADSGGLISYGPDFAEQYPRAAEYIDRILKGEKPGDPNANQSTVSHQPQDRKGARTRSAWSAPATRRRGDRITVSLPQRGMSAFGTKRTSQSTDLMSAFGGKRTLCKPPRMSASDPKRTLAANFVAMHAFNSKSGTGNAIVRDFGLGLKPLERARTKLKLAPGLLVRSAPKPRRVVDRVGA